MSPRARSITVLIPTFQRRAILERCLAALAAQTRRDFRVVVVDDGSSDGTWEWLSARSRTAQSPSLTAVRQQNRGQGRARNRGLEEIEDGLVLFLGDDILPQPGLVAEHLAAHAASPEPRAVVGFIDWCRGEMKVTPALEMANREGHQFGFAHMRPGEEVPFTCFYTSNVSVPRSALGDAPFDDSFQAYGWEDIELGFRLHRQGLELIYWPSASAEHLHPMTLADLFHRQRLSGRGFDAMLRLHPELAEDRRLTPERPPRWFPLGRRIVPPLLGLLSKLDGLGVDLGRRVLHRILICGYYMGRSESPRPGGGS